MKFSLAFTIDIIWEGPLGSVVLRNQLSRSKVLIYSQFAHFHGVNFYHGWIQDSNTTSLNMEARQSVYHCLLHRELEGPYVGICKNLVVKISLGSLPRDAATDEVMCEFATCAGAASGAWHLYSWNPFDFGRLLGARVLHMLPWRAKPFSLMELLSISILDPSPHLLDYNSLLDCTMENPRAAPHTSKVELSTSARPSGWYHYLSSHPQLEIR